MLHFYTVQYSFEGEGQSSRPQKETVAKVVSATSTAAVVG